VQVAESNDDDDDDDHDDVGCSLEVNALELAKDTTTITTYLNGSNTTPTVFYNFSVCAFFIPSIALKPKAPFQL
jgi:hypothetical protein